MPRKKKIVELDSEEDIEDMAADCGMVITGKVKKKKVKEIKPIQRYGNRQDVWGGSAESRARRAYRDLDIPTFART